MQNKNQWGLVFYLCAVAFTGACVAVALNNPYSHHKNLYTTLLPAIGLAFSLTAFFAGHFSYPRVQNIKVYLAGYITGLFGIAYFALYKFFWALPVLPRAGNGFVVFLYLLMLVNGAGILFLSSAYKYRLVRQITLSVITVESVLVLVARLSPQATQWARGLDPDSMWDPVFFTGMLLFALVAALSWFKVRNDFYLGGLLAGWAFFFAPAWASRVWFHGVNPVETALFSMMPVYLTASVIIHWFLRMEHRVQYDPLLHIYNRDFCSKIISEQSNINTAPPFTVAMLDLDHFKNVNDTYGHQAGDVVLYSVAQAIQREVVPNDTVCRYGGEEIVVFFSQKSLKDVVPVVEKLRAAIQKMKIKTRKKTLSVTVSCGVSTREDAAQSIIDVIHAADKALYKAKKEGRNQVRSAKTPLEQPREK
ncbi:MAG TPA: GGDEF domain-containing protein [Chitinivibrionales bacterium]|nr:GGDEF domain-containing protein [Chitinivibrionales bacterium]